jgi:hypothetical protein
VSHIYSLPFTGKGTLEAEQRARVGMGCERRPHPHPRLPPEGIGIYASLVGKGIVQEGVGVLEADSMLLKNLKSM